MQSHRVLTCFRSGSWIRANKCNSIQLKNKQEEVVSALWDFMRQTHPVERFCANEPIDPKFLEAVGTTVKRILAIFGKTFIAIQ